MLQPRITYSNKYSDQGAYDRYYKPSLGDAISATAEETFVHNPTNALIRTMDSGEGGAILSREEAQEQYGIGNLHFDEDISEGRAKHLHDLKLAEMKRNEVISRSPQGVGPAVAKFGVSLLASMADPINIASAFVPAFAVRNAAQAARVTAPAWALNRGGTVGQRAIGGAFEGVAGAAMIEPIPYLAAQRDQLDYDAFDSFLNVTLGGIMGAGSHSLARAFELRTERKVNRLKEELKTLGDEANQQLHEMAIADLVQDRLPTNSGVGAKTVIGADPAKHLGVVWANNTIAGAPKAAPFDLGVKAKNRYGSYTNISGQDMRWIDGLNEDLQTARSSSLILTERDGQGSTNDVLGVKSESPHWFQEYNKNSGSKITKEKVQSVVDKLKNRAPLGEHEGRIAKMLFDEARAMRETNAHQMLDFRDHRAASKSQLINDEITAQYRDEVASNDSEFDFTDDYRNDFFADMDALNEFDNHTPVSLDTVKDLAAQSDEIITSLDYDLEATGNGGVYADILEAADQEVRIAETTARGWRALGACMLRRG